MARVSLYLKAARTGPDGTGPVYLRLTPGSGQSALLGLGLRLKPSHWNVRRQQARPAAPAADRLNEALRRALVAGQIALAEAAAANGGALADVPLDDLRARALVTLTPERAAPSRQPPPTVPPERACLLAYGALATARYEREGRVATARAYRTAIA